MLRAVTSPHDQTVGEPDIKGIRTPSVPAGTSSGGWLVRVASDPLLHFVLLGAILFLASMIWQRVHDPRRITIDAATLERIAQGYQQRFGTRPTSAALKLAVADHVADEVLYREGKTQAIDRDDEIIRRRIIQKMRFILEGSDQPAVPPEEDLRAFYQTWAARYALPTKMTFSHIYFRADDGEAPAFARAANTREAIADGKVQPAMAGDPFPDRSIFTNLTLADVERVFGASEFSRQLERLPVGAWSGPLKSGLGVHLVHIEARSAAHVAPFEAVRERVVSDLMDSAREARDKAAIDRLVARYEVELPRGKR